MKKTTSNQLTKKITKYSALVAAITAGAEANSQIIYTDLDPDETRGYGQQYLLNLNANNGTNGSTADNADDFRIQAGTDSYGYNYLKIFNQGNPTVNNGIRANDYGAALLFDTDEVISAGAPYAWIGDFLYLGRIASSGGYCLSSSFYGYFCQARNNKFLGLRINISGNFHYGWLRLSTTDGYTSWTIEEFAYNATPGEAIQTGQTTLSIDDLNDSNTVKVISSNGQIKINNITNNVSYKLFDLTGKTIIDKSSKLLIYWIF